MQRLQALLYGIALGDALGWPIEFLKLEKVNIIYGPEGIKDPPDPALITDDTQTTLAVAEALIESADADIDTIMRSFTRRMIAWSNSPDNTRAPGHTVTEAVRTLEAGASWQESGVTHSKGNGSSIRVAAIGYMYQFDPDRLRDVAWATGIATHAHPTAIAGSIAAAYLVKLALDGVPPEDYVDRTLSFLNETATDEFTAAMQKVQHVAPWTDELAAMEYLGSGWVAEEAVSMAVYCSMRYFDSFPGAVRRAVNISGDSDSVGSITGGIVAARLGLDGIPENWVERIENLDALTETAKRLAARRASIYGTDIQRRL